jgi:hypothetical protein
MVGICRFVKTKVADTRRLVLARSKAKIMNINDGFYLHLAGGKLSYQQSGDRPYYAIWFPEKANQLKNLGVDQDFLFMDHLRLCYKSTDYATLHK